MPKVKSRSTKTNKKAETIHHNRPSLPEARNLIGRMIEYESAAAKKGINFKSSRYAMLTNSETQMIRAELVSEYIRLCMKNIKEKQDSSSPQMVEFCSKICDLEIPSHELLGTYLAALETAYEEELLQRIPKLDESLRRTVIDVLNNCADMIQARTAQSVALNS